jgi:hypothetical protein
MIHSIEKALQNEPRRGPRFRYLGGRMLIFVFVLEVLVSSDRARRSKRIPCGTAYVIFRNSTAEVMIELNAVVEAR